MVKVNTGCTVVDESLPVLKYLYSFGPGIGYALAVGTPSGLFVVSPPCRVPAEAMTDLAKYGKVVGLIAPNAYHNMGLKEWAAHFPEAKLYGPAQALARLEKISGHTVYPVSDSAPLLGDNVDVVDMPHYRTGEVLVRMRTPTQTIWYVTDVIMNLPALPPNFPIRQLFKWTKSAPGLRLNGLSALITARNRRELYRWLAAELDKAPPTLLVPCHGQSIPLGPNGGELREVLSAAC